jgi:predicted RNA-binding protein with PUA-like domain
MKKASRQPPQPAHPSCWLMKTEPHVFSIDDLAKAPHQTTSWIGVRNYQARNFMRDDMRLGDPVLIYHSSCTPPCVVGTACVARTSHPDHSSWDPASPYFDPKSSPANPRWFMVDVRLVQRFECPIPIATLRQVPALQDMLLLRRGMRLSIQPVTQAEFACIAEGVIAKGVRSLFQAEPRKET